jgi:hypothetical protein
MFGYARLQFVPSPGLWLAILLASFMLAAVATSTVLAAPLNSYTAVEIGLSDGSYNFAATGLNDQGDVCGNYRDSALHSASFAYLGGTFQTLYKFWTYQGIQAYSINDAGVVVGMTPLTTDYSSSVPVYWSTPSGFTAIPKAPFVESQAMHINNNNQVAMRAVVWNNQSYVSKIGVPGYTNIGTYGSSNYATTDVMDITDGGIFAGNAYDANTVSLGMIGTITAGQVTSLTTFSAFESTPTLATYVSAVNSSGASVGMGLGAWGPGVKAYKRNADGSIVDLGLGGGAQSWAADINDKGLAVGSHMDSSYKVTACVFRGDGTVIDLDSLVSAPYLLTEAAGINNKNQIVANGKDGSGHTHAFLLTPTMQIHNGNFGNFEGDLSGWTVKTTGDSTASLASDPLNAANHVLLMITGSPIEVDQTVNTPTEAFLLDFQYYLPVATGQLDVSLNGAGIGTILGSGRPAGVWNDASFSVTDPGLLGLLQTELKFVYNDTAPGSQIYLDNILLTPEPATLSLLALGGLMALRRRR